MGFSKVSSRGVPLGVFGACDTEEMWAPAWAWCSALFSKSLNHHGSASILRSSPILLSFSRRSYFMVCYSSELLFLVCTIDQLSFCAGTCPSSAWRACGVIKIWLNSADWVQYQTIDLISMFKGSLSLWRSKFLLAQHMWVAMMLTQPGSYLSLFEL